jgi:N-acetylmuramoyl-L-alanine amidase
MPFVSVLFETPSDVNSLELEVFAKTIYGEARGENYITQELIAWVIRNRKEKGGWYGDSYSKVCLKPYQFSCWNRDDPNYKKLLAPHGTAWETAKAIAAIVTVAPESRNPIPDVLHYVDVSLKDNLPQWAQNMQKIKFPLAPNIIFLK